MKTALERLCHPAPRHATARDDNDVGLGEVAGTKNAQGKLLFKTPLKKVAKEPE
jgi:hypothetical protein